MIIKSTNVKINEIISKASQEAHVAFLKEINDHTKAIPEGEIETVVIVNSVIVGIARLLGGIMYRTVPDTTNYSYAFEHYCDAIRQNMLEMLKMMNEEKESD